MKKIRKTALRVSPVRSLEILKFFAEKIVAQISKLPRAIERSPRGLLACRRNTPSSNFPNIQIRKRIALIEGNKQGRLQILGLFRLASADNSNDRIWSTSLDHINRLDRIELDCSIPASESQGRHNRRQDVGIRDLSCNDGRACQKGAQNF